MSARAKRSLLLGRQYCWFEPRWPDEMARRAETALRCGTNGNSRSIMSRLAHRRSECRPGTYRAMWGSGCRSGQHRWLCNEVVAAVSRRAVTSQTFADCGNIAECPINPLQIPPFPRNHRIKKSPTTKGLGRMQARQSEILGMPWWVIMPRPTCSPALFVRSPSMLANLMAMGFEFVRAKT